ncbi:troponin C, slow skeletal and cardiac muscles-like [Zerene cesonia]|uniref:troponin C, slow skeletal and cardiac muscles-like n=1 Tax=Zerene cesonia TaxID=33412 RepID=UPI0018E57542|nr:troponin C, slow skeletal and cardiac muscles-like [Zerene cesonia]
MGTFDVYDPLRNVNISFTEEQLIEISEWFDATAKPRLVINNGDPINVITIDDLKQFLELKKIHRRSFHYPSYGEIMIEAEKLKAGITRMLTKEQMIYMLNKWTLRPNLKHELKLAFKVFDTEKRNFLDIEEIKVIVNSYGDVFNESETLEMLRDANVSGNGNVIYEEFVESLFSLAPELNEIKAEYLYDDPDEDPSVPPEVVSEDVQPPPLKDPK